MWKFIVTRALTGHEQLTEYAKINTSTSVKIRQSLVTQVNKINSTLNIIKVYVQGLPIRPNDKSVLFSLYLKDDRLEALTISPDSRFHTLIIPTEK
jgi:hypothetical protein